MLLLLIKTHKTHNNSIHIRFNDISNFREYKKNGRKTRERGENGGGPRKTQNNKQLIVNFVIKTHKKS